MAELPIADFLRERLREYDPNFEVRKGTAFDTLIFKPLEYILQPFRDEADALFIGQSMRRILQTENPDTFNEELVDDLVANVFVYRNLGGQASGVARVYYDFPVNREYPANGFTATGSNSKNYSNPATFAITEAQMSAQMEAGLYYLDIPVVSVELGKANDLDAGNLISVIGDTDALTVTNKNPIRGGVERETNTQVLERAKKSISVRDLVTGKGFSATLLENFPNSITEIQAIGFGDSEMMRDIVYNCHIGGKHDGYIKTPYITTKQKDVYGILVDITRATWTSTQVEMTGTDNIYLGESSIDRTKADPIVSEVKPLLAATYTNKIDLSSPVDLSAGEYLKITVDTQVNHVKVSGTTPSTTTRAEIMLAINKAFGIDVIYTSGNYIKFISPTSGNGSRIIIDNPDVGFGTSAFTFLFAPDTAPIDVAGSGPIVFIEGTHYTVDDSAGTIKREEGTVIPFPNDFTVGNIVGTVLTGNPGAYQSAEVGDILRISNGVYAGDYRILSKPNDATVIIDTNLGTIDIGNNYTIRHMGIKKGELVYVEYYFNPLSVDIGKYVKLDELGKTRGIRPGREDYTITDVPFLKVNLVEVIDPVSGEATGEVLNGEGGFGLGGFGEGSFGIGSSAAYRIISNSPTERFSAFEDSYIVFDSAYQGYSFRITYECVPELEDIHNFCRSDNERVLDGDILIKHFIPAYVDTTIEYTVDTTDSSIPTNEALVDLVRGFVDSRPAGYPLDISDITQFILKNIDPYFKYTGKVKPFTLVATILNTDGTTTMVESGSVLEIPTPNPYPKYTEAPISSRICHWVAGEIIMVRN
jgi:hypothetical protein